MGPAFLLLLAVVASLYDIGREYVFYLGAIHIILYGAALGLQHSRFRQSVKRSVQQLQDTEARGGEEHKKWEELREKQDFFALWAHQIKTPIAALDLLLQGEKPDSAGCRQELFKIEGYVEMALNYLRFEEMGNDLVLEKHDLEELVRQAVKKYAAIFIYNHISIRLENLDYAVLTDEKWFCFVLEQLLSNALKYTRQGSVAIFAEETEEGIRVNVRDTGIGIRSGDLPRIFEKGFTGYNGRLDKKASGLGLYLCKGICGKLGHKIEVTSKEGEGTNVALVLRSERVERQDLTRQ